MRCPEAFDDKTMLTGGADVGSWGEWRLRVLAHKRGARRLVLEEQG